MISIIRALTRLFFIAIAITACFPIAASHAQAGFAYVSATGSGSSCTATQPCSNFSNAIQASLLAGNGNGQIVCLSSVNLSNPQLSSGFNAVGGIFKMDCPAGASLTGLGWGSSATNSTVKFRNVTFTNLGLNDAILFRGSGTIILENCVFEEAGGPALDIEPSGPLNLVIRNSRISNSASGILLKPAASGSINATFDHVTIANNTGGGIKADSSNGPVTVDIFDSNISENGANGLNISSGTGTQNDLVNITRSTIAKNGLVGIQTGGSNGAVMLDATLLDSNANGATLVVGAGRILSYGNNRIVGSAGSGFSGSLGMQ